MSLNSCGNGNSLSDGNADLSLSAGINNQLSSLNENHTISYEMQNIDYLQNNNNNFNNHLHLKTSDTSDLEFDDPYRKFDWPSPYTGPFLYGPNSASTFLSNKIINKQTNNSILLDYKANNSSTHFTAMKPLLDQEPFNNNNNNPSILKPAKKKISRNESSVKFCNLPVTRSKKRDVSNYLKIKTCYRSHDRFYVNPDKILMPNFMNSKIRKPKNNNNYGISNSTKSTNRRIEPANQYTKMKDTKPINKKVDSTIANLIKKFKWKIDPEKYPFDRILKICHLEVVKNFSFQKSLGKFFTKTFYDFCFLWFEGADHFFLQFTYSLTRTFVIKYLNTVRAECIPHSFYSNHNNNQISNHDFSI